MKTYDITISANEKMVDITASIKEYVKENRIKEGMVLIQVPKRTSAVNIAINDDWRMEREFFEKINHLLPKYDGMKFSGWTTLNVKAGLIGQSLTLMVSEGTLVLEEGQSIYFIEFNGPGERQYFLNFVGSTLEEGEVPVIPDAIRQINEERLEAAAEVARIQEEMREEWRLKEERLKNNQ